MYQFSRILLLMLLPIIGNSQLPSLAVESASLVGNTYPSFTPILTSQFLQKKDLKIRQQLVGRAISEDILPCDCHIQGLGYYAATNQIVLTCQDKCQERKGAFLILYNEKELLPLDVKKGKSNAFFNHPSAIQISNGIFPVAFAAKKNQSSYIDFYRIEDNQLKLIKKARIEVEDKHIGALAFATFEGASYLIGVGWDAEDLTIWKHNDKYKKLHFEQIFYTADSKRIIASSAQNNWGPYNSLWLGLSEEGKILLMGTHGKNREKRSSLDIWEIKNLTKHQPTLHLVSSKKLNAKTSSGVNYFYEGVTVKNTNDEFQLPSLLAAPHDFTSKNCPTGFRCSSTIYEIW